MLRNPVDMAYSLHAQKVRSGDEDITDFESAWNARLDRELGELIPLRCREPRHLLYHRACALGEQVQRLFKLVPPEQCMCILFEDFKSDPEGTYRNVLDFCGLRDVGRANFPQINVNVRYRFGFIQSLLKRIPRSWHIAFQRLKHRVGIQSLGILPALKRINEVPERRPPLPEQLREEIAREFKSDIELLSQLLERDLSHWTASAAGSTYEA